MLLTYFDMPYAYVSQNGTILRIDEESKQTYLENGYEESSKEAWLEQLRQSDDWPRMEEELIIEGEYECKPQSETEGVADDESISDGGEEAEDQSASDAGATNDSRAE